jgi:hypothetical protein
MLDFILFLVELAFSEQVVDRFVILRVSDVSRIRMRT